MNTKKPSDSIDDCLTQVDYSDITIAPPYALTGAVIHNNSTYTLPGYRDYNFELASVVEHLPIRMIKKYLLATRNGWAMAGKDQEAVDLIKDINEENKICTIKRLKLLGW